MAMAISPTSGGEYDPASRTGAMSPAAVTIETVADPCETRTTSAIMKASSTTGMFEAAIACANASPTPVSMSTSPSTPPAPVTKMMSPTGSSPFVTICCTCGIE